jgi:hypothetical protein
MRARRYDGVTIWVAAAKYWQAWISIYSSKRRGEEQQRDLS